VDSATKNLPSEVRNWIGRQLFEHVPNNIAVIDRDFKVVTANSAFKTVFGEPEGKYCYEAYKSKSSICKNCMASRTFQDGRVRVNDEVGVDKDGRPAHYVVHIAPVFDEVGKIAYLIQMSYDLTETKSLQREYNILFERVPCYVSVINRDLRIVRSNRLFRKTFGDNVGEHCYEVYKQRSEKCPNCPTLRTFADGKSYSSEQVGIDQYGQRTNYVVSTSPLARSGEEFSHVIEMSVDITEKLEAERQAAVGQTVAQLSHGIKNILTGLRGGMYAIKSGTQSGSESRTVRGWEMLERNVDRITLLVRGFLNYSKQRVLKVEPSDPAEIAREVYELYEAATKEIGVTLNLEIDEPFENADLEPAGIHTCLANLVSNAIDACELSDKEHCEITLRVKEIDGTIIYEVEDQGCGMDPEVKDKVFRSFFTTKGLKGTGLGLLVTRKTVEEHGGRISVDSVPGEGSIFRIELPRTRLPRAAQ
jgi:PAS domain S-box-containing protein